MRNIIKLYPDLPPVSAGFLLGLLFYPENGANMSLKHQDLSELHSITAKKTLLLLVIHQTEASEQQEKAGSTSFLAVQLKQL
jgi:hypothetical protein